MMERFFGNGRVHTDRNRAVFILIALAGVLPSALVLWFASLAVRNEQAATTRIEEEANRVLLNQIKADLVRNWNTLLEETDRRVANLPPAAAFYETIMAGGADGLIVFMPGDMHRVAYPDVPTHNDGKNSDKQLAARFAVLRAAIQRNEIVRVERAAQAILGNPDFERHVDENGRHTLSNIELLMLENRDVVRDSTYASVLSRLTKRLNDYRFDSIAASQRRFLMSRISPPGSPASTSASLFPTMAAESLSAQFMETNQELIVGHYLHRSTIEGVWQQSLPIGHGIVLFTEHRIRKLVGGWLAAMDNRLAARVRVEVASDNSTNRSAGIEMFQGAAFSGWHLRVVGADAERGTSLKVIYVALSVASVGLILLILLFMASITLRRLALAHQKNTMVATVSHELRTPVSSIKLLVDALLQDAAMQPDRAREYLHLIARENSRLGQLVENVLSVSRIERTKFRVAKEQLDISALIREAVATFFQQAEITDRELTVEIAPDMPFIRGDAWALSRVMLNLLDNAYKFSDPPRQIRVSTRVDERGLVISVSDRGIGICEADFEKIFHQFYQADQRLSRGNEGCGLGLGIVKHIVNLHGGSIEVSSELGVGSIFTVHLPLEQR